MTEEEFRDLQERVLQIEEMAASPGWAMLIDRARLTMLSRQTLLIQGKCHDHTHYVKECSFIEGLEFFTSLPKRTRIELDSALVEIREEQEADEEE